MHSPFKHLLHTNAVPSDAEHTDILGLLENPRQQLADLQALIEEASRNRDELQEYIDAHLALSSSARRLPDDIVRVIFVACLPPNRNPAMSGDEPPILLCQICRSWRSIALMTPRLWAAIQIVVPAQPRLQHVTSLVTAWLGGSGTVPHRVSMVLSQTSEGRRDGTLLVSTLVAESRRWEDLQLEFPTHHPTFPLTSLSPEDVPLLQSITLKTAARDSNLFGHGPSNPPTSDYFLNSPVSWRTLKHLVFTTHLRDLLAWDTALAILRECTMLETCELPISSFTKSRGTSPQHFCLPRLSHLHIQHQNNPGPHFFTHPTLPNLISFYCQGFRGFVPEIPSLALLWTFSNSLEYFEIAAQRMSTGTGMLANALSNMTSLQELHILGEPPDQGAPYFLANFIPSLDGHDAVICPSLRCIELMDFDAVSDMKLLQFIRGRTDPSREDMARLSSASVTFTRSMQLDIIPKLQDVVALGVVINLSYPIQAHLKL
ncbi:hypothetical protein DFH09DRAFT_1380699 [Mycena vulgaris]|nr:hypothetical protein DFH09DRAFT_1380699 [Mycena vulgaris]